MLPAAECYRIDVDGRSLISIELGFHRTEWLDELGSGKEKSDGP